MADPITTVASSDTLEQQRTTNNTNFDQRLWLATTTVSDADHTVVAGDELVLISATTAARTVTLPAASTETGRRLWIYATAADATNTVTVDGDGSETVGGSTTQVLNLDDEFIEIVCDGSNWLILGARQ